MDKKNYIILSLLASVIILAVGYLRLASVQSLETKSKVIWNVHITDIKRINQEGDSMELSPPTHSFYSATYNVGFVNKDDSITYEIKVKNDGNIDAKLKTITIVPNNNIINKELDNIFTNEVLKAGKEKTFKLKLTCMENIENYKEREMIILDYVQY